MAERQHPYRGWRIWRLVVTTCKQGTCRRIVDQAWTYDHDGNRYESVAIILRPWRRNQWGEYPPQRALVVGWRQRG
jgi:hypothetical protein